MLDDDHDVLIRSKMCMCCVCSQSSKNSRRCPESKQPGQEERPRAIQGTRGQGLGSIAPAKGAIETKVGRGDERVQVGVVHARSELRGATMRGENA